LHDPHVVENDSLLTQLLDSYQPEPGGDVSEPLIGNKSIEDAAITIVLEHEHVSGREAKDSWDREAAGDIETADRTIEVKAAARYLLSSVEEAERDPRFFVYFRENDTQGDQTKFELRVLGGYALRRPLARAKERSFFEVPLPAAEYELLPRD
jgi:hypothetical protein